ncbi:hypothetical protein ABK040_001310 [Willaertia magna]
MEMTGHDNSSNHHHTNTNGMLFETINLDHFFNANSSSGIGYGGAFDEQQPFEEMISPFLTMQHVNSSGMNNNNSYNNNNAINTNYFNYFQDNISLDNYLSNNSNNQPFLFNDMNNLDSLFNYFNYDHLSTSESSGSYCSSTNNNTINTNNTNTNNMFDGVANKNNDYSTSTFVGDISDKLMIGDSLNNINNNCVSGSNNNNTKLSLLDVLSESSTLNTNGRMILMNNNTNNNQRSLSPLSLNCFTNNNNNNKTTTINNKIEIKEEEEKLIVESKTRRRRNNNNNGGDRKKSKKSKVKGEKKAIKEEEDKEKASTSSLNTEEQKEEEQGLDLNTNNVANNNTNGLIKEIPMITNTLKNEQEEKCSCSCFPGFTVEYKRKSFNKEEFDICYSVFVNDVITFHVPNSLLSNEEVEEDVNKEEQGFAVDIRILLNNDEIESYESSCSLLERRFLRKDFEKKDNDYSSVSFTIKREDTNKRSQRKKAIVEYLEKNLSCTIIDEKKTKRKRSKNNTTTASLINKKICFMQLVDLKTDNVVAITKPFWCKSKSKSEMDRKKENSKRKRKVSSEEEDQDVKKVK